jgi:diguanylate cyclase (GGDEF)-like protein
VTELALVVTNGRALGKVIPLSGERLVFGRAPVCDCVLEDEGVSRRHFTITRADTSWLIEDLRSASATYVNGARINGHHVLRLGDKIQIGSATILKVRAVHDADAVPPPESMHDALTGLLRKTPFADALKLAYANALKDGAPLSLALLDVDSFARVNAAHGHPIGDRVLRRVADVVRLGARSSDVVARYGGDELGIIMVATELATARAVCERIRVGVEQQRIEAATPGEAIAVTISAGVAQLSAAHENVKQLVRAADEHLYTAKRWGRNRVRPEEP